MDNLGFRLGWKVANTVGLSNQSYWVKYFVL